MTCERFEPPASTLSIPISKYPAVFSKLLDALMTRILAESHFPLVSSYIRKLFKVCDQICDQTT
jgi:hypothetical protein